MGTNGHESEQPTSRRGYQGRAQETFRDDDRLDAEGEEQQSNFFSESRNDLPSRQWQNRAYGQPRTGEERFQGQREARFDERFNDRLNDRRDDRFQDPRQNQFAGRAGGQARGEPQSSEASRRRHFWQKDPVTAREVMTADVRSVGPDASIIDIATLMREEDVGIVPVVDSQRTLLGVVTDRDLVVRALTEEEGTARKRAEQLASKDVKTVETDTPIGEILELMGKKQIRRVPVTDANGVLLGMVSIGDIAQRADQDEELQEAFQKISGRRSFWSRIWR